ncbi:type VI secretion system protein TssL [Aureimonas leprariae]|uniref:Type VI secretion system protein TssL n=2 Tax=Plantimonas leprariae TaxID=2615207 RepID=A0A7V7PQK7_9HYPH|nr:type VI secretion system protein TssL [Aureimonas leprariae]
MVASAAPLLNLAHALRHRTDGPDIAAFRDATLAAVKAFERDLAGARIAPDRARAAHYVVCATVDDVVLSQPWGVSGGWAKSGLVSTFHMDVTGGDRVFDLLEHFHRNPGANRDILLLIYLCLSLAFEGRTRVSPRGSLELGQIRDGLYRTLRGQFGAFERELSPHWRGLAARHKPLRTANALWLMLGLAVLALALGYLLFLQSLNRVSDATLATLAGLGPTDAPSLLAVAEPPKPPETQPVPAVTQPAATVPAEPPKPTPFETFAGFLKPETDAGTVRLQPERDGVLVRLSNKGLFDTGSAEVKPEFRELLNKIGGALSADAMKAVVIGHTDNVPIRTAQYPSNWHLSQARAKAVADVLAGFAGRDAVAYEGRAETQPIADNGTDEGREANRRTEIFVAGPSGAGAFPAATRATGEAGETR